MKDTTVVTYAYGGDIPSCWWAGNGFSTFKIGDTLYWGTQSNGGIGGLVMQLADGTWCNVNTNFTTTVQSITKYQGKLYVGTL